MPLFYIIKICASEASSWDPNEAKSKFFGRFSEVGSHQMSLCPKP